MTTKTKRARVERAGSKTGGYEAGWFATQISLHVYGDGEWFPTWREAMECAVGGPLVSEATA
ncbi:hypothetical protein [Leifsonia aquatica]|uniref:hypothetical protein n=1 Tax=Leifsonia aquatica TaxID=144185 RepID=UPI0028AC71A8|nr:hypothetical protein [Leifsonia aquatica]